MRIYYVYILASNKNGTLYLVVTNNLTWRLSEHIEGTIKGFTSKYGVTKLVYFEQTNSIEAAIQREKQLKRWNRDWKLQLIERYNPNWNDLSKDFL